MQTRSRHLTVITAATLLATALVATVIYSPRGVVREAVAADKPSGANGNGEKATAEARALSHAFRRAAEVATPAVVTIHSRTKAQTLRRPQRGQQENPFKGTPFEDFFGNNMDDLFQNPHGAIPREGTGSGVIIDPSGIVLTNNHVVNGADEVTIHLADGREFKGEDIRTDERSDLAIVHIQGAGTLTALKFGDSDELEIGDWVLAIGNPFELEQTVSAGIISGKARELNSIRRVKFLQTDAAINPGNSGGPLVDLDGHVVGINTAIATNTGTYNGIGFAVPGNTAKWVADQLMQSGSVQRAYLGVGIDQISPVMARKLGVGSGDGVLIQEVYPKTPAADAGLQSGDVITAFGDVRVRNPRELQETVERAPLGSKHKLSVIRDGKPQTLEIVAQSLPDDFEKRQRPAIVKRGGNDQPGTSENEQLGLSVAEASKSDLESLGMEGSGGVMITEVDPNGLAYESGLRVGMAIMKVGKTPVRSARDFEGAMAQERLADGILFQVRTKAGSRFVVIEQK